MKKIIIKICTSLLILATLTSCTDKNVLKEPLTNTEYFMKLPDEAINIKIDSDD